MWQHILPFLFFSISAAIVQKPFLASETSSDEFEFSWPIEKVAIIGAGPSGIIAYRELTEAGLDVRIFERDGTPGGNWHYTEEVPLDAPAPNLPTPVADFSPSLPPPGVDLPYSEELVDNGDMWRAHRQPKPIWESLTTNTPSFIQQFPQWPWPVGTPWELPHHQIRNYIRSYASYLNINSNDGNPATSYNTRVEHVEKRLNKAGLEQGWRLWLRKLEPTPHNTYRATWWTEDFDAVVVAVGRYNSPSVPSIPGLEDWVRKFPDLVRHVRQYRRPQAYANQTVLIVGASVSGTEVSIDLNRHAGKIYQSFRPDNHDQLHYRVPNLMRRIPQNTTLVGEIKEFLPLPEDSPIESGRVELKNGTIFSGIDSMILCTGYRYSYSFLSQYYDGATYVPHEGSASAISPFLPLDGSHVRDLYLDVFYIPDPTLAFIGSTSGVPFFSFPDYTALALAKVWTNTAKLPSRQAMETWYEDTVEERGGLGKYVMFMGPERTAAALTFMNGWLNEAAVKYGGKQVDMLFKHPKEIVHYWELARLGGSLLEKLPEDEMALASLGLVPGETVGKCWQDSLSFYDDNW